MAGDNVHQAIRRWVEAAAGQSRQRPLLLFVSGAQGAGKSTALRTLEAAPPRPLVVLGLDDFYLTHAERKALVREVHPLCATRGPPGTHDLDLLEDLIGDLLAGREARTPVFDKVRDDRSEPDAWRRLDARPEIVIVEGWLMGAQADGASPHEPPLNAVEEEDQGGVWRAWQEAALAGAYARLWDRADGFLHLDAPDFGVVAGWRIQQEEGVQGAPPGGLAPERRAWVRRFVQHFERITRRMLAGGRRPGELIHLDRDRRVVRIDRASRGA